MRSCLWTVGWMVMRDIIAYKSKSLIKFFPADRDIILRRVDLQNGERMCFQKFPKNSGTGSLTAQGRRNRKMLDVGKRADLPGKENSAEGIIFQNNVTVVLWVTQNILLAFG